MLDRRHTPKRPKTNKDTVRQIALAQALYDSRRISLHQYVVMASFPVEDIHSKRWLGREYDDDLAPLVAAIDAIERTGGLGPNEYWGRNEGPPEHIILNQQYEDVLDQKFESALREFGLDDLSRMYRDDRERFDKLRERGRRSVFHDGEYELALRDLVDQYEREARKAANVGAYTVAIAGLGAGIEGLLLLRCLRSPVKSAKASKELARRPKSPNDPKTWSFETLIEVCLSCGWLPPIETAIARYDTAALSHMLRHMRNYIHPARRARDKPWAETDGRDFADAEAIYIVLLSTLAKGRSTKARKVD